VNLKPLCTVLGTLLCLASPVLADTIIVTSSAMPTMTFNPSSDTITLTDGSATLSAPGSVVFQTGDIFVGNSPIADQVIPFFFEDTVTINGVTRILTIYGEDNVTAASDDFSIFAGAPVDFGSYVLSLNACSYLGISLYQDIPIALTADLVPVPEPGTLLLLATGLAGGTLIATRLRHGSLQA